ncbi:amino acid adenylation domain-containing protein [Kamptonema sp. UHCC 0994]|uniref:non-ribosomal peptide synthetase n=1 Tax=Kamptonema sp. UHCC 0994 TaxID=3031329 RepID=UPI0023BA2AA8|nr:amino acid adenylation domain-containing protein [Kamptonema sp. UHCC 0994]MDF0552704.1 amino acid adenylation domain-containing protein [Kamptonema sp. UHCC 0994]
MQEQFLEGFRISPQQKRLWMLQQSASNQPYRATFAVKIAGNLNLKVLELALQNLVSNYEILRTNFQCLQGMILPLQIINNQSVPKIIYYNLSGKDPELQAAQVEALFAEVSSRLFDLERGFVLDICLVILSQDLHLLLVGMPALVADRATVKNFVHEISRFYDSNLHGKELCDQPLQYADIAEWQNELFEGADAEIGREYWRKNNLLKFVDLSLPNEKKSELKVEFKPEFIAVKLDIKVVAKIESVAQKHNISTAVFILTCWLVLLWRLTGNSDIVVGTYCEGRNYEQLESALGLFAKYLPVYSHFEEKLKFSENLKQVSESVREAFKWQESFTWEQGTELTEKNRELFFPICFEFEEQLAKRSDVNLSVSIDKQYFCLEPFKVKLSCIQQNDLLNAEFHYDSSLFQIEDISRLAGQFQTLLESTVREPETPISELEILSDRDRHQILVEFNQSPVSNPKFPDDQCIHQLFEQQVEQTPDRIAIVFENQQLTYQELNKKANCLADRLQKLGVGPDVVVALYTDRSLDAIVGLLAILKAGGAYLPLDPALPSASLAFRWQDARSPVLLTQTHLAANLSDRPPQVICLDADWDAIAKLPDRNPNSEVTTKNLVYVLFTSGSTGKPKGVAVEHRQLLNYLNGICEKLELPTGASFATVSTFAADLGNTAIFPSLCTGGCLHIVSSERTNDPAALAEYFNRHAIDCLKIVPSHLAALLAAAPPEQILPRKCLVLGGEAANWELICQIQQHAPNCRILNHYGPTETTVGTTTFTVQSRHSQTVPLGRALPNCYTYVLDRHRQPVPIGVPGELYIGGAGLARGYLNRAAEQAERFIANPFVSGERLYKTGDSVRYLPDGNLEFLGRVDHQVKIRGFRIELGEIETVLSQHPQVRQAIASLREDEPGNQRLVAYVVLDSDRCASPATNDLQSFLRQRLPEYMMPSAFVLLKSLPLTANGKVDRRSLPVPDCLRPELAAAYVAPQTEIERAIATIWQEMLHLDRVGIHDNFFDLGGHSLLIVQLYSKLQGVFNQTISITEIFKYPTINSLAKYLNQDPHLQPAFDDKSQARAELRKELIKQQRQSRKYLR